MSSLYSKNNNIHQDIKIICVFIQLSIIYAAYPSGENDIWKRVKW